MSSDSANISATRNGRHSGIETLRLLSMFFIVALHANFFAFGYPDSVALKAGRAVSFLRVVLESISIVGVDCFILISGWFGIRPRASRLLELLFQCAFFCLLLYGIGFIAGVPFDRKGAVGYLFLTDALNWFIKAYLALYFLAPVLDVFAVSASEREFRTVLVAFFAFQSVYGWIWPQSTRFFSNGYSAFSFIGLYLLARYMRRFQPRISRLSRSADLGCYFAIAFLSSICYIVKTILGLDWPVNLFAYSSPLVIAASLFLFLFFSKSSIQSDFVNSVAKSSYAVYLFHMHPVVGAPVFVVAAKCIASKPLPIAFLLMPLMLIAFFVVAILMDCVRILAWKSISRAFVSGTRISEGERK